MAITIANVKQEIFIKKTVKISECMRNFCRFEFSRISRIWLSRNISNLDFSEINDSIYKHYNMNIRNQSFSL